MSSKRRRFSRELKAKVALEALRGDRTLHESADGIQARRLIGDWVRFDNLERPHSALDGRIPAEADRGDPPVEMWTSRSALCPHLHRRNNSNRTIQPRGFWRPEKQPEYTLTQPPDGPKRWGHLSGTTRVHGVRKRTFGRCCSTSFNRTGCAEEERRFGSCGRFVF